MLVLQVVCNRSSEVEELKSIIETLRENQARLQKDNAEEIEQLHEVIEKLQRELPLGGPEAPKAGEGGAMSLQSELLEELRPLQCWRVSCMLPWRPRRP